MKHYLHEIIYPVYGYHYQFVIGTIPDNTELFAETIAGTKEKNEITFENGIATFKMPIWVINPIAVKIGYKTTEL